MAILLGWAVMKVQACRAKRKCRMTVAGLSPFTSVVEWTLSPASATDIRPSGPTRSKCSGRSSGAYICAIRCGIYGDTCEAYPDNHKGNSTHYCRFSLPLSVSRHDPSGQGLLPPPHGPPSVVLFNIRRGLYSCICCACLNAVSLACPTCRGARKSSIRPESMGGGGM